MADLLIRNARLVDGTGVPWRHADVEVTGDTISDIGRLAKTSTATRTIDADGTGALPDEDALDGGPHIWFMRA